MGPTELVRSRVFGELDVSTSHHPEGTVVTVDGEADVFTRPVLVDALIDAVAVPSVPVVVDLSRTDFIDAGSMRVLALASRDLHANGRSFTFRSPSRIAALVIDFFGLRSLCEGDQSPA